MDNIVKYFVRFIRQTLADLASNSFMLILKNGQTYSKNLAVYTAGFLKYVWPFFNIMHERINLLFPGSTWYNGFITKYGKIDSLSHLKSDIDLGNVEYKMQTK